MSDKNRLSDSSAKSYSQALYELASEEKKLNDVEEHAISIIKLISQSEDFNSLIKDPTNRQEDQLNVINLIFEKFNLDMIIINSNLEHTTDEVVNRVKNFKEKNPKTFQSLCDEETKLVKKSIESLRDNDMITLGKCMSQNQIYLEQIGVSNDKLLSIIESIERTSLGIKITGAGDGGCLIMLVDPKLKQTAIDDLETNSYEYFSVRIDHDGVQIFN